MNTEMNCEMCEGYFQAGKDFCKSCNFDLNSFNNDNDDSDDSDDDEDLLCCEKCGFEDYKNEEGEWTEVLTHAESDKVFCKDCMPCDKKQTKPIVVVEAPKPIVEEPEQFCCSCGKKDIWYNLGDEDTPMCKCNPDYEGDDEAEEWDGDLDDTPNCFECGEDCGHSIVSHQKFKNTYFCSEKCNKKYDGEESDDE
jgi:hypothetical protein